ncbi:MAG TPA: hypothetical protein VF043_07425 [Ktedonobacteraceae bacterium]
MIDTFRQGHDLPMVTPAAILTRVGRIDFDNYPASFFRFAGQLGKEGRPRRVMNALGQTMIMRHAVDMQVFHTDDSMGIDDLTAFLMGEVIASECNSLMHTGYDFTMLMTFRSTFCQFALLALHFSKGLFLFAKETGIANLTVSRQGSKRLEPYVNPHLCSTFRQAFRLTLTRERSIPFTSRGTLDGESLHLSLERPVQHDLDMAYARGVEFTLRIDLKPALREGEAVIAVLALEAWKSRLFGMFFHPSEEGFDGKIKAYCHVLQHLGMDASKRGMFSFQYREGRLLLIEAQRTAVLLIDFLTSLQQVVIEPSAFFQGLI